MTDKLREIETEGMHFDKLLEALARVREAAARRDWDIGWLQTASQHATALGFYRDDNRWLKVAAMLDELAKRSPASTEIATKILEHLEGTIRAVKTLKDRRLN